MDLGLITRLEVTKLFFDANRITSGVASQEERAMSRFGAFVMTAARRSIKAAPQVKLAGLTEGERSKYRQRIGLWKSRGKSGKKPRRRSAHSQPGNPPFTQTKLLPRNIFFVYDRANHNVIIGPVLLGKSTGAQKTLEHGGEAETPAGKRVTIEERPYMKPALAQERDKAPEGWRNTLR